MLGSKYASPISGWNMEPVQGDRLWLTNNGGILNYPLSRPTLPFAIVVR
jgi:hypothetical protein